MKRFVSVLFSVVLICLLSVSAFAQNSLIPDEHQLPRLVDDADILTDSEEKQLLAKLDEISERQDFDVAVVTVESTYDKTAEAYADDFYDYNGYGMGENDDGVLLLVSMEERDWHITTHAFGVTALTDAGLDWISERFLPDLSDDNYAEAFTIFANCCDDFVTQAKTGEPYDSGNLPKAEFDVFVSLLGAWVAGGVFAMVVVTRMKGQLKSVKKKENAADYTKAGSMNITQRNEIFLYNRISKRRRQSSSSGGSSTHTSSSGRSHGGRGGKF